MNLTPFTRQLEECRKRWHRRTVKYVLEVARIVRAARIAAKSERRWGRWIREEIHMNRTTVYRYFRVAEFLKSNVDVRQQLTALGIVKIYALSRLSRSHARRLLQTAHPEKMSDVSFLTLARRFQPRADSRITLPNLTHSLDAALRRLERSMTRWEHSDVTMPAALQMRLQSRLNAMTRALNRIRRTSAAAI